MKAIILDTHTWIWAAQEPSLLSPKARDAIQKTHRTGGRILLSRISIWELAKLFQKQRFKIQGSLEVWIHDSIQKMNLEVIELETPIILDSISLPGTIHSDPADQLIISTARLKNALLVSKDKLIQQYEHVASIW